MKSTPERDVQVYEIGYLVWPLLSEEEAIGVADKISGLIVAAGGEIVSSEQPKLKELAYSISQHIDRNRQDFGTAYFGWVKFEIDRTAIDDLVAKIGKEKGVVRHHLIKTVKNAPIPFIRRRPEAKKKVGKDGEEPVSEQAIDQEIDALIASTEETKVEVTS